MGGKQKAAVCIKATTGATLTPKSFFTESIPTKSSIPTNSIDDFVGIDLVHFGGLVCSTNI
jgi:hypothetical protein